MAPVTGIQGAWPLTSFAKKNYFKKNNFQLFFHEFLSNWIEMGPELALSGSQNSKISSITHHGKQRQFTPILGPLTSALKPNFKANFIHNAYQGDFLSRHFNMSFYV